MTYSMLHITINLETSVIKYLYSAHVCVECKIIRISHYKMKGPTESMAVITIDFESHNGCRQGAV